MPKMGYMKGMIDRAREKAQDVVKKYSPFTPITDALDRTGGGGRGASPRPSPPPVQKRKKIRPKKSSSYFD